jgi:hypothetical protein
MGRACSTFGERRNTYRVFFGGGIEGGDHLQDSGINGRIILKGIFEKWGEGH